MTSLLSIDHLSVDFKTETGKVNAIKGISFSVNKGEIVGIVGESGSGKSVTALSILQLLPPPPVQFTSGKILFSEDNRSHTDLVRLTLKQLRKIRGKRIGMIFQEPMSSLNPLYTCGDQVMETILLHENVNRKIAKQKTIDIFNTVQLPEPSLIFSRYPHQLSGGQKQRVMIAIAVSCNPSLLICDEPTTALDVTVQRSILELIRSLRQQTGMGVIFITHDLGIVQEIADRALVMHKGEIVESGTTTEIFMHAKHPYTKALLLCRPVLHNKGERLPTVSDFLKEDTGSYSIKNKIPSGESTKKQIGNTILKVNNLSVRYITKRNLLGKAVHSINAVDNISFEIFKGETLGLVGESGSGKTTLGRALLRLINPSSGSIEYNEINLVSLSEGEIKKLRKHLQIVFQDPYSSLNPRLTIGSAISEPLKVHSIVENKQIRDKVSGLLISVDLDPTWFNRYPHEFSGGQRQRIVIARALSLNPSFLICDESVSALDVSVQAQVLNLLNDLKQEFGFTMVFISHDLSVVHYLSDRIMVMNNGKIEEIGEADQIYYHPSSSYSKKLIASIPGINN